jgi:hypothetical protein
MMQNLKCFKIVLLIIFFTISSQLIYAQEANLDFKVSNIGPVMQVITNHGNFGGGDTNFLGRFSNDYPAGEQIPYGTFALWIGGIRSGEKLVVEGGPWSGAGHYGNRVELLPTAASWDTVWVVNRNETVDIPYWNNYQGRSDQDLVCRYNDTERSIPDHEPLYIDITQVTYAWTSIEFLVHQFWMIPLQEDLQDVWIGLFGNMSIGRYPQINQNPNDEYGSFDIYEYLGIVEDRKGGNDDPLGPIGFKIFPDIPEDSLKWTWIDGTIEQWSAQEPPNNDYDRYEHMAAGLFHDPIQDRGYGHFLYDCGPFQLAMGDTLHFTIAQILGEGFDGMYENLDRLYKLKAQDYHMPAPPPMPPVRFEVANHQVTIRWEPQPGDVNPETFTDEYRGDGEPEPFEGYRIYKSYESLYGPWILLAEFDRADDFYGENIGLEHSYTDIGLLNNLEYYYSVTAFSKPDSVFGTGFRESSMNANSILVVPGTATPETVGEVAVVPNPYRADQKYYSYKPAWEKSSIGDIWVEEDRRIQFINLPNPCEIKIYTLSGKYVNTLFHDDPMRGFEDWNLTSHVGQTIASGIYLFSVKDIDNGKMQVGKFVVIK